MPLDEILHTLRKMLSYTIINSFQSTEKVCTTIPRVILVNNIIPPDYNTLLQNEQFQLQVYEFLSLRPGSRINHLAVHLLLPPVHPDH